MDKENYDNLFLSILRVAAVKRLELSQDFLDSKTLDQVGTSICL